MSGKTGKRRLDEVVVQEGLAETRARAQALIQGGGVAIDGAVATKAGATVPDGAVVTLVRPPLRWVSRGGLKLEHALAAFHIHPEGVVAVDVGASTGGFTDVLLANGARRVYAIDVGYGQLAWTLRNDPRVVVRERTNIRDVESLPEQATLAVVDVSFISLRLIFPVLTRIMAPNADVVVLIKPQFEAGKERVGKGGVVRDPDTWRDVIEAALNAAQRDGWGVRGLDVSPIRGPAGNVEFLAHLQFGSATSVDIATAIDGVLAGL